MEGLTTYMDFYNGERLHQSLDYLTPNVMFNSGAGEGTIIVDKFGGTQGETSVPLRSTETSPY